MLVDVDIERKARGDQCKARKRVTAHVKNAKTPVVATVIAARKRKRVIARVKNAKIPVAVIVIAVSKQLLKNETKKLKATNKLTNERIHLKNQK